MTDKPPLPARTLDPWPRIPINTSEGADFHRLNRIAGHAATGWALSPEGTYARNLTLAETVDGAVREALLHLLELGLIDIDAERMNTAKGWPTKREHLQHGWAPTDPVQADSPTDCRQPAYEAVFAYIRQQPRDFLPATVVDRNAMIWHAVHAALDAFGVPKSPQQEA